MKIVKDKITLEELKGMSEKMHMNLVKAVVDIQQEIMAVDAELHSDLEMFMLDNNSIQENLWGINFHPSEYGKDSFVEFDSMINLRPGQGNRSRGVENPVIREKIKNIVRELVQNG